MKDQYVILTGSMNNAGDYLIKHRAKELFKQLRPDRLIVDYDAWKPFSSEQLDEVNNSRALILTGGPALQQGNKLRKVVYPMLNDLDKIKIPIIMMGIGYKGAHGTWDETVNYKIHDDSMELLQRINESGYQSGVRDYHTLNVLLNKGFSNFIMTGCPALYNRNHIGSEFQIVNKINKIGFSLGVSCFRSPSMYRSMQEVINKIREGFSETELTVFFHHKINRDIRVQDHMLRWLEKEQIAYEDISGTADLLIKAYASCDIHIGYRVHAHIFSSSVSKPSVLITEDGRASALRQVTGGLILDGYARFKKKSLLQKAMHKLHLLDIFEAQANVGNDLVSNLQYELANGMPRLSVTRKHIDHLYPSMKGFLEQLP